MLHFENYGDFADYFGPRWHYYLRDIIATIPVPLVFSKGQFERGVAAKLLNDFAEDPFPYLDEKIKKKMTTAHSDLLRKFTELAFDVGAEVRWQETQAAEADLQNDLVETPNEPF